MSPRVPPTPATPKVGQLQMNVPGVQLKLEGAQLQVVQEADQKVLVVGPVALVIGLPLTSDVAKSLAGALLGGIEVPSGAVVERVGASRA